MFGYLTDLKFLTFALLMPKSTREHILSSHEYLVNLSLTVIADAFKYRHYNGSKVHGKLTVNARELLKLIAARE